MQFINMYVVVSASCSTTIQEGVILTRKHDKINFAVILHDQIYVVVAAALPSVRNMFPEIPFVNELKVRIIVEIVAIQRCLS